MPIFSNNNKPIMKKMTSFFIQITTIFTLVMFSSCGSTLNPDRCEEVQTSSQTFIDAASVYSNDPSTANCKSYKETLEDYINVIEDCTTVTTFGTGKEEVEDLLDSLDC